MTVVSAKGSEGSGTTEGTDGSPASARSPSCMGPVARGSSVPPPGGAKGASAGSIASVGTWGKVSERTASKRLVSDVSVMLGSSGS